MPEVIESCMQKLAFIQSPNYEELVNTDAEARKLALELAKS